MITGFPQRALELAVEAAGELGIDPAGAAVLRVASAVTVELPGAGVIARVEPPGAPALATRQVVASRILEQRRVPAARLVAPDRQPLLSPGGAVTLWHRLEIIAGAPDPESMGRLARRLHTACADNLPADTPALDPFGPLPGWLERPCGLPPPPQTDQLWTTLEQLREGWEETAAADPLGQTLVHGDFHVDNVVLTPDGPTLLDLEMTGKGPASWDLMAQELAVRRYGGPAADYERFCAGYGAEPPAWEGLALLRQAYELHLVAWAVGHRDLSPAMAEQATVRLGSFLGRTEARWTLI